MKKLTLLIFLLIFSACKNENKVENPNGIRTEAEKENRIENPNGIWTEDEVEELNSIIIEFDNILIEKYQTDSIEIGYLDYSNYAFENNLVLVLNGMPKMSSDLKKYKVFDKIWQKYHSDRFNEERFNLKPKSQYLTYLSHLGKTSKLLNDYYINFESTEDIQPSVMAGFAKNIKEIDLSNKNYRLVFAIHYLTLINR